MECEASEFLEFLQNDEQRRTNCAKWTFLMIDDERSSELM